MTGTPTRWAVFRLGRLGDVALATGVLEYWRQRRGLEFAFMTREAFAPILKNHPALDKVSALKPEDLSSLGAWLAKARSLAKEYKGWGLLDLHGTLRSHLLSLVWRGPVKRSPKHALARRLYRLGDFPVPGKSCSGPTCPSATPWPWKKPRLPPPTCCPWSGSRKRSAPMPGSAWRNLASRGPSRPCTPTPPT